VSLLATQQDFEPADEIEGADALYYQPADGSGYDRFGSFATRIAAIRAFSPPAKNQELAIWGCGFGYLLDEAVTTGYEAYGFDASSYAITRGKQELPAIASLLFVRDALNPSDVLASAADGGIKGANPRFSVLVTEDLLTCMSDAEISTTLPLLRARCTQKLFHIVSPLDPTAAQDQRINWKTDADWKMLVSPDVVYDAVLGAVV
jgi:hypothetical protein